MAMTYYPIMRFARAELTAFQEYKDNFRIIPTFCLTSTPRGNLLNLLPNKFIYDIIVEEGDEDTYQEIEKTLLNYCKEKNLYAIPTIYDPCLKTDELTCLRVNKDTFTLTDNLLGSPEGNFSSVEYKNKILLLDFGAIDGLNLNGVSSFYHSIKALLGLEWTTMVSAGTVIPSTMGEIKGSYEERVRHEWSLYEQLKKIHPRIQYGDYAARHPESSTPGSGWAPYMDSVSKIRYTTSSKILILKGISMRKHPEHYCELAKTLVNKKEYKDNGEDFSQGDKTIMEYSKKTMSCGNHETWIKAEHSHHIAVVIEQLSSLDDS